jgi:hypothetical protein
MTFQPIDDPVDYILLAGQQSPGLATIEGAGSPRRWEERRGYANSGSTIVYRGRGLAAFKVLIRLWEPEHFTAWETWSALVKAAPPPQFPRAGTTAADELARFTAAKDNDPTAPSDPISQQQLRTLQRRAQAEQANVRTALRAPRAMDIAHPQLEELGIRSVVVEDLLAATQIENGLWQYEIRFKEFRVPQFALSRPAGSQAQSNDPVEQRIDQNSGRIRVLAQQAAS